MKDDITIPPAALEAARKAYMKCPDLAWHDAVDAACLAMLKAWPEMGKLMPGLTYTDCDAIILPLPQEPTND